MNILLSEADYRRLLGDVPVRETVVSRLAESMKTSQVTAVVSATTRAMVFATLASVELKLPMAYVRPKPKTHGKQNRFEGHLPAGSRVALLFDLPPNDASLHDAIEAVADNSGSVVTCIVISGKEATATADAPAAGLPSMLAEPVAGRWDREATAHRVAEALLTVGAVTVAPAGKPYEYASGLLSPIYTDNRLLISHPNEWSIIIQGLVGAALNEIEGETHAVAGVVTSGLPHAAAVAARLKLPIVYTDSSEPPEKTLPQMEGSMGPGQHVLVIEDLVTTGKSLLATVQNLRTLRGDPRAGLVIFTYDKTRVAAKFAQDKLQFAALCDLPTLLEIGLKSGRFGVGERDAVLEWVADPAAWTARHESERPSKS